MLLSLRTQGLTHGLLALAASSLVLAACSSTIPTEAEATSLLEKAFRAAERKDFAALCAVGGGNCEQILAAAGEEAVPEERPTVVGTFVLSEKQTGSDTTMVGGRVVVLCGRDAMDRDFRTEVLVFLDDEGALRAIEPVYWSGNSIASSTSEASEPNRPACP